MKILRTTAAALTATLFLALPPRSAAAGAEATPDQPPAGLSWEPRLKRGVLENQLRYAILPNENPKGRVSLRLIVKAGSLDEEEDQRGLAHFLEHMAFNGSTHFEPGSLVAFFQRLGMSFGGDTNAFTTYDRTQYMMELSHSDPATLSEGLRVLSDSASGLLLRQDMIDKERGIILSEARTRDDVGSRANNAYSSFLNSKSRIPERLPIGLTDVIRNATRERLVDFYDTWYRPENLTLVIVGDVDVEAAEKALVAAFSPLKARAPSRPRASLGQVDDTPGLRVGYHFEKDAPSTVINLTTVKSIQKKPDTLENRIAEIPLQVATSILNRRFSVLANRDGTPYTSASVSVSDNFDFVREATLAIETPPATWEASLTAAENELRSVLEQGFSESEVQEQVTNMINSMRGAAPTLAAQNSPDLANELADTLHGDAIFTPLGKNLDFVEPALKKLSAEDCTRSLREAWAMNHRRVFVMGNVPLPAEKANELISAAYQRSTAVPLKKRVLEEAKPQWAYHTFGTPGRVVERKEVPELGLTLLRFENGVRVNLKETDFEPSSVQLSVRVGRGAQGLPVSKPGLSWFSSIVVNGGGLGRHGNEELSRLFAGARVGMQFRVAEDAFVLSGETDTASAGIEIGLLTAKVLDPGFRGEGLREARRLIEETYSSFEHSPAGPQSLVVERKLAGNDPRFGMPTRSGIETLTVDDVRNWIIPEFAAGAIEVGIVGDFDTEALIPLLCASFGALPPRVEQAPGTPDTGVSFPAEPFALKLEFSSDIPKGLVNAYWPTDDGIDISRARRLSLLSEILGDRLRLKIREEMGGSYSPAASSFCSSVYPGYGYLFTSIDVAPEGAAAVREAVLGVADDLARNGIVQDELDRARQPILTSIRESRRENRYWINAVVGRAQSQPLVLKWARNREEDLLSITKEELSALAAKYLAKNRASQALILPQSKK